MRNKTREMILVESGRYMLDMSKLIFGGLVLVVIMQIESLSNIMLLIIGCITVLLSALIGIYLTWRSQTNKQKGKQ